MALVSQPIAVAGERCKSKLVADPEDSYLQRIATMPKRAAVTYAGSGKHTLEAARIFSSLARKRSKMLKLQDEIIILQMKACLISNKERKPSMRDVARSKRRLKQDADVRKANINRRRMIELF